MQIIHSFKQMALKIIAHIKTENPAFFDRMDYEHLRSKWHEVQHHLDNPKDR